MQYQATFGRAFWTQLIANFYKMADKAISVNWHLPRDSIKVNLNVRVC